MCGFTNGATNAKDDGEAGDKPPRYVAYWTVYLS